MTRAVQIIERAYSLLGVKAAGDSLSAEDAAYGLDVLNTMIDAWNANRLYIISTSEVIKTVTSSPVSIGPGATVDIPRPVRLEDGTYMRLNGVDFIINLINVEEYNKIAVKSIQSPISVYGYYDQNMPTANLWLWPKPVASCELHLLCQNQLTEFASLTTDITFAPGYRMAIEYSLAELLSPGVRQIDPLIIQTARTARKAIATVNVDIGELGMSSGPYSPYADFIAGL